ncbi:GNAT family N-acetyltransferase [Sporolituus thermophilus]|uniref:Acetyltransferase (GNAT) family protein n=1 Tax=Sporolituus thermophilus DSM 23256 TaxID=1123285 RepID=A0A1G7HTD0_9FIRM|nr:GNAT family N-acetyltransferase [Sporolituus thermophilus]SDF03289.1 Acetyltransferase (GNAT) family protein [Sporolituus thermophilus DSM 23256]
MVSITIAQSAEDLGYVRDLLVEYASSRDYETCFVRFEQELAELPGVYAPPDGRLLLAMSDGQAAGCVALKKAAAQACEMKRLYVRPGFRGRGIGRALAEEAVRQAKEIGYASMRLETLPVMREALALYQAMGFVKKNACSGCCSADIIHMELRI